MPAQFRSNVDETASLLPDPTSPFSSFRNGFIDSRATHPASVGLGKHRVPESQNPRIAAIMYSFIVLGLFTSSIGVMLPPISHHYGLNDLHVSFIFLVTPLGYVVAASSNTFTHSHFGQRGVAILGPLLQTAAAVVIGTHPANFVMLLGGFWIAAMGAGLLDGSWCAWTATMERANFASGLLHGSFSVGAAVGPFLAGTMMTKWGREWWEWYYVLGGASVLEFIILLAAFRKEDGAQYQRSKHEDSPACTKTNFSRAILSHPATWISAAYFLTYVGTETAISGWIVTFMTRARHASLYLSSISSSGFWAGMAIGRLALGHITDRVGVRRATTIYLLCAILLQLCFAVLKSPIASVVLMTFLGFFMGPLFPSGVVVLTRLLPEELHIAAVSFVSSLGQVGGAALPFGIGAVVQGIGIEVFGWVVLSFTCVALGVWVVLVGLRPSDGMSTAYEDVGSDDDT